MNGSNTVFYSTANDGYALYAATSLLTVRDFIPDAELYLLSSGLTNKTRFFLEKNDIKYLEIDLSQNFSQAWEYPVECYYIFAGPAIFHEKKYKYSVYIDGDILCRRNPLEDLKTVKGVTGVKPGTQKSTDIFGEDWKKIRNIWSLSDEVETRDRIHSGVVYFNNKKMQEVDLLGKTTELYDECLKQDIPRKGDDSLFSLFQLICLEEDDITLLSAEYNFMPQYNKVVYPAANLVFLHFSMDKPWKQKPYTHEVKDLGELNPYVRQWRMKYRHVSFEAWLTSIKSIGPVVKIFEKAEDLVIKVLRETELVSRGLKKNYVTRRLNRHKRPLRLYWWRSGKPGMYNFGDEVTSDIIGSLFGYRSTLTSLEECELIGAGSILQIAQQRESNNPIKVWGSGLIEEVDYTDIKKSKIYAVRGTLTREKLGLKCSIGDPGVLASLIYKPASKKLKKIGVVVHYIDKNLPIVKRVERDSRFLIIDPLSHPSKVAEDISSCRAVLSSSLHGLIFADSFGIPNVHIKLSNNVTGGSYKFRDYASSVGREYSDIKPDDIFNSDIESQIVNQYTPITGLSRKQKSLVKAFPNF